jgi:hypothetical protein
MFCICLKFAFQILNNDGNGDGNGDDDSDNKGDGNGDGNKNGNDRAVKVGAFALGVDICLLLICLKSL